MPSSWTRLSECLKYSTHPDWKFTILARCRFIISLVISCFVSCFSICHMPILTPGEPIHMVSIAPVHVLIIVLIHLQLDEGYFVLTTIGWLWTESLAFGKLDKLAHRLDFLHVLMKDFDELLSTNCHRLYFLYFLEKLEIVNQLHKLTIIAFRPVSEVFCCFSSKLSFNSKYSVANLTDFKISS